MEWIKVKNLEHAGKLVASQIEALVKQKNIVLGLATGSSPIPVYDYLIKSDIDFSNSISINLDEYVGLNQQDPQSYYYFMHQHLFQFKPFKKSYIPDGSNLNAEEVIHEYEEILKQYPIDIQLLGIGRNGHIGFNEPGTPFNSRTHKIALADSTIEANQRFFTNKESVPRFAYTMGLANIMQAKQIFLIACGKSKSPAIKALIEGDITTDLPASILQTHPNVTLYIDDGAASLLNQV